MNLARLLQLASPSMPVGAYSYSGGLEAAIEAGAARDTASAERWIGDALEFSMARMEGPIVFSFLSGFSEGKGEKHARAGSGEFRAGPGTAAGAARNAVQQAFQVMTLRVGVGGPVGSGKTALVLALCKGLRDRFETRRCRGALSWVGTGACPAVCRGLCRSGVRSKEEVNET